MLGIMLKQQKKVVAMAKIWYKLIFKQISPIHIGIFNYGVLSETRIFIPGWTMWGALVNKYGQHKGKEEYFEEGKKIFESITCFYPKLGKKNKVLFPEYKNGEFYLGDYSENKFRAKFTDVYVSTSIQPLSLTAKDESLHEIEVILPKSKFVNENKENLYWIGLLGIDEDKKEEIETFLEKNSNIIVGGDNRYGLGNMKLDELVQLNEATNDELSNCWGITKEGKPIFEKDKFLKNYFSITDGFYDEIREGERIFHVGTIEHVIIDYDFSSARLKAEKSKICVIPGSKIKVDRDCNYKLIRGIFQMRS